MRVNARLDPDTEQQLDYLTQATGHSVSLVVREAVAVYYAQVRGQRAAGPSRLLALAGQARSGRADLSVHYKQDLGNLLDAKFPPPPPPADRPPADDRG